MNVKIIFEDSSGIPIKTDNQYNLYIESLGDKVLSDYVLIDTNMADKVYRVKSEVKIK